MLDVTIMSWKELNDYVLSLASSYIFRRTFVLIRKDPITPMSIDLLVKNDWQVEETSFFLFGSPGRVSFDTGRPRPNHIRKGKILLHDRLDGYERDKTLCHELVHAWYGRQHIESGLLDAGWIAETNDGNRAVAEWIGRKIRANPGILSRAVYRFGLRPHVYDRISYIAFECQKNMPVKELPVFMD